MKNRFLLIAVLVSALLVLPIPRAHAEPVTLLAAWVAVVTTVIITGAQTLQALGDAYEAACVGAGFEYHDRDEHNSRWHCTGYPFKKDEAETTG